MNTSAALKRQLPKPPAVSPLVFNNDSGIASLEDNNKCSFENSQFDEKNCEEEVAGNSNSSTLVCPQNNFWVGFTEESSVNRRPKNHDRLTSSSSNKRSDPKKRHSAPPGSLDQFNFNQNPKKSSVSGGHVNSRKSSQNKS